MQLLHRFRIDYVLFAVFAAFLAVLVASTMLISYELSALSQARSTSFYQQGMLLELNKELTLQLNAVEQTSLTLSLNSSFLDLLKRKGDYFDRNQAQVDMSQNFLSPIVNSSSYIQSIQVYMDEPAVTDPMSDVQFLPLSKLQDEAWDALAEKADSVWIGEHSATSSQGSLPVLSFVRVLSSPTNPHLGTLVINVKLKALQTLLSGDKQASRFLLDTGGRLKLHTGTLPASGEISELFKRINTDKGYQRLRVGGRDVLMVWARSFSGGWLLVELTPWSEITKGSLQLAETLAVVGGAAILLALMITLLVSRQFTAPVRELLALMNAYALNRSIKTFPSRYRNEFGSLFGGYRKMIDRIEELYTSLEQQYKAQRKAEIQALQAMINPHFLYNTLDQLNWMAIEAGHDRMSEVLELMGRMFRIGLSNGASFITIRDELMHTECYLRIQQLRLGDGLQYSIRGGEEVAHYYMPKLTLQPFVENAVRHGFHGRTEGRIEIDVQPVEDGILFTITDNGVGISPDWQHRPKRKTGGYGIRNVMERIEANFGSPYGVAIEPLETGQGTKVTVHIPKVPDEPDTM